MFEEDADGPGVDGWTDVGPIRGDTGSTGPAGADGTDGTDGVSVTGAAIDGAGHLIITRSTGSPIDAGVAKGAAGTTGATGAPGLRGTQVYAYDVTPPAAATVAVGDLAIGDNGDLLEAV